MPAAESFQHPADLLMVARVNRPAAARLISPEHPRKCGQPRSASRAPAPSARKPAHSGWPTSPRAPWNITSKGAWVSSPCQSTSMKSWSGRGPALARVARRQAFVAAREQRRPDRLRVAADQPAGGAVLLHRLLFQCISSAGSVRGSARFLRGFSAAPSPTPPLPALPPRRTRARMVGHHAPALRSEHEDVGRDHPGRLRPLGRSSAGCVRARCAPRRHGSAGAGPSRGGPRPRHCRRWSRTRSGSRSRRPPRGPPGCTQLMSSSSAQTAIRRSMSPCCSAFIELVLDVVG